MISHTQWIRKISLLLFNNDTILDLSEFHIKFHTEAASVETPNSCAIKIYNVSKETIGKIKEYASVTLSAGYEDRGNFGTIFEGTIKQYRIGKENATDTFIELLAADGDIGYCQGFVSEPLRRGASNFEAIQRAADAMKKVEPKLDLDATSLKYTQLYSPAIRGSVQWGMARNIMRSYAETFDAGWSIQNGKIVFLDNTGYKDDNAIVLNSATGLISIPTQTSGGVEVQCLLNSRLRVNGLVSLDNKDINQLIQNGQAPIAYNSRTALAQNAPLDDHGIYMVFAITHEGDTRGEPWYSHLTCLALVKELKEVNKEGT